MSGIRFIINPMRLGELGITNPKTPAEELAGMLKKQNGDPYKQKARKPRKSRRIK